MLCILCTAGILATQSRMGLIVLFLCGLSVLLSVAGRASRKPVILGLVFTFLVGAYALMPRFIGENDPNAYSRIAIWQSTVEIVSENPFGVGLGGAADALRIHGIGHGDLVRYAHVAKHSHSEFLNLILECGWPGLILLLLGLGYVALIHFRLARDSKTITKDMAPESRMLLESPWSAVAITLSFLLPALTSNTWHVPPVAYLMVFWFSFLHDTYTKTHIKRPVFISSMLWVFTTRILVVCAFAFVSTQALGAYALRYAGKAQEQGDIEAARPYAHLAARLGPWNIGPQLMHAALDYNTSGSAEGALKSLADLAQRFSKSPEPLKRALFVLKHTHGIEEKKKSTMMLKLREELAKREPKNALLWLKAGESAESVGDFVVAENFFRRALEVEPHCARALAYVAGYEKKVGNIEDAHKYVKLAWQSDDLAKNYKGYALDVLSLDQRARQHLVSLKVER
ncbi:MAG: O-antigen ligase family protein [Myxococcota bacterium]|nr:O-antigen ligase family protein [Myxococcota bacterium]